MPYIPEPERKYVEQYGPRTIGQLNYVITTAVLKWLDYQAGTRGRVDYTLLDEAVGVLECAKLEFYARRVRAYEEAKIQENGDVY